ncbi:flagellar basal-body MS-ring/collar protein FliF [Teichococcus aestuarii]|uniref:Flagellar M-ring protein n=1 Tax=Teichococcus aestuarii TaxID=568898 RepID=A0A2U1V317_9PROT|nr:flagellar basal-body MS-ring/collar protein FliF [Pseudoroseomonas aestuarii]PWC28251.1 flagellar M-ring protein FliF [Pseudoroseomonas aestuarii]
MNAGLQRLLASLRALGPARLAMLGLSAALTLGVLGYMVLRTTTPPMALLYAELDPRDAAQVVAALERARVPHRIGRNGTEILAPEEQVPRLRLMLARDGLPSGGSIGYEIFDRQGGLTTTPFQQDVNRLRAMEGEIARSIRALEGVAAARVHLALPRREPFSRERSEAQASVVLQMRGAQRLDREGVQAVLQLVASAVPGLKPQNVAVVDGRGELLSRGQGGEAGGALAQSREELRRAQEMRMARGIEEMLERTLGPGRVRAEATLEMDLDRVQVTEERFDPDNQVPRSQSSTTESNRSGEPQNVTVANQLPGAPAPPQGGPQTQEQRQEETINYEIGRTTRSTLREQPMLRRLSVAVLVDGVWEPAEEPGGAPRFRERTAEELARISALVRGAIGFNEARGDRLEVVSLRFADPGQGAEGEAPSGFLGFASLTPALTVRLVESGLLALVVLVGLLLGRPVVKRLIAGMAPPPAAPALPDGTGATPGLPAPEGGAPAIETDQPMMDLAMVQGQIRVSSLNNLAELVDRNPDETLAVLRRWLTPQEAKP